jgi:hypothetical protein
MQLLADVAGDGSVPSLWDLLWPILGLACLSVLVVIPVVGLLVAHLMNFVARLFDRPMGSEPGPGRSADCGEGDQQPPRGPVGVQSTRTPAARDAGLSRRSAVPVTG